MRPYRDIVSFKTIALFIGYADNRILSLVAGINNNFLSVAGLLIRLFTIGNSLNDRLKFRLTFKFRDDNRVIRIPATDLIAFADLVTILNIQIGSVRNVIRHDHFISAGFQDPEFT